MGWFSRKPRIPKDIQAKYHSAFVAGYKKGRNPLKDTVEEGRAATDEEMKYKFHSGYDTTAYRDAYERGYEDGAAARHHNRDPY
jgi:hypothetical protein